MTVRLKLLCHAATPAARAAAFPADEQLDAQARRNLAALSLRPFNADRHWMSPAQRARQTAEALGLEAAVEPLLRDCDYGRWAGRSLQAVQTEEPEAVGQWLSDPQAAPHGGELILALSERVAAWLDAQQATTGTIVAITHASVIRAAIVHAIDAGPRSFWRFDIAPLSLTRLSGEGGRWNVTAIGAAEAEARRR